MTFAAFKRQDLVSQVSETLTKAILEGDLEPGSRLNEVHLSQQFEISRAPLREALRRLESQGLIESHPRRGFFLRRISAPKIAELFQVRLALEHAAGQQVVQSITEAETGRLECQYEAIREAASNNDPLRQTEEDFRFHRLICEMSGNTRLLQFFDQIACEIRYSMVHLSGFHDDMEALAASHVPLLDALKSRDAVTYCNYLKRHLDEARDKLVAAVDS
ncbi:GntR family transcriptional regulator [Hoeflea prorocentri]|uniref:GntR family transcriptional regulator n=1 Tax=Hoeflea prorocentri TaxID=1922333 RepID=A0A9X3ZIG4_9HYPH|nr:GntR family transcriptional regulator [Hoeflea prorocentri]MCY6381811.1 GntR family transcriptional regulator [Hoeflea prorocentri]MDA5399611.1 GntR family transcriptional regulator [Hoeflea prorocentri]